MLFVSPFFFPAPLSPLGVPPTEGEGRRRQTSHQHRPALLVSICVPLQPFVCVSLFPYLTSSVPCISSPRRRQRGKGDLDASDANIGPRLLFKCDEGLIAQYMGRMRDLTEAEVCAYIYRCIRMYLSTYLSIYLSIYLSSLLYIHVSIYLYIYLYIYIYIYILYTYIHTYTHTRTHAHTYIYIYIHNIYVYIDR